MSRQSGGDAGKLIGGLLFLAILATPVAFLFLPAREVVGILAPLSGLFAAWVRVRASTKVLSTPRPTVDDELRALDAAMARRLAALEVLRGAGLFLLGLAVTAFVLNQRVLMAALIATCAALFLVTSVGRRRLAPRASSSRTA